MSSPSYCKKAPQHRVLLRHEAAGTHHIGRATLHASAAISTLPETMRTILTIVVNRVASILPLRARHCGSSLARRLMARALRRHRHQFRSSSLASRHPLVVIAHRRGNPSALGQGLLPLCPDPLVVGQLPCTRLHWRPGRAGVQVEAVGLDERRSMASGTQHTAQSGRSCRAGRRECSPPVCRCCR